MPNTIHITRNTEFEKADIIDNGCHGILCAVATMLDQPAPPWNIEMIDEVRELIADMMQDLGILELHADFYPAAPKMEDAPDYCRNCDSTDGIMLCPACLGGTGVLDKNCEACGGKGHAPCPVCNKK